VRVVNYAMVPACCCSLARSIPVAHAHSSFMHSINQLLIHYRIICFQFIHLNSLIHHPCIRSPESTCPPGISTCFSPMSNSSVPREASPPRRSNGAAWPGYTALSTGSSSCWGSLSTPQTTFPRTCDIGWRAGASARELCVTKSSPSRCYCPTSRRGSARVIPSRSRR
jgi:hypothetical protein